MVHKNKNEHQYFNVVHCPPNRDFTSSGTNGSSNPLSRITIHSTITPSVYNSYLYISKFGSSQDEDHVGCLRTINQNRI